MSVMSKWVCLSYDLMQDYVSYVNTVRSWCLFLDAQNYFQMSISLFYPSQVDLPVVPHKAVAEVSKIGNL